MRQDAGGGRRAWKPKQAGANCFFTALPDQHAPQWKGWLDGGGGGGAAYTSDAGEPDGHGCADVSRQRCCCSCCCCSCTDGGAGRGMESSGTRGAGCAASPADAAPLRAAGRPGKRWRLGARRTLQGPRPCSCGGSASSGGALLEQGRLAGDRETSGGSSGEGVGRRRGVPAPLPALAPLRGEFCCRQAGGKAGGVLIQHAHRIHATRTAPN